MSKKLWKMRVTIFPEPKVTSSKCLSCPTSSPKHKDSSFTVMKHKEMQHIYMWEAGNSKYEILFLEKWLKWLTNY